MLRGSSLDAFVCCGSCTATPIVIVLTQFSLPLAHMAPSAEATKNTTSVKAFFFVRLLILPLSRLLGCVGAFLMTTLRSNSSSPSWKLNGRTFGFCARRFHPTNTNERWRKTFSRSFRLSSVCVDCSRITVVVIVYMQRVKSIFSSTYFLLLLLWFEGKFAPLCLHIRMKCDDESIKLVEDFSFSRNECECEATFFAFSPFLDDTCRHFAFLSCTAINLSSLCLSGGRFSLKIKQYFVKMRRDLHGELPDEGLRALSRTQSWKSKHTTSAFSARLTHEFSARLLIAPRSSNFRSTH